MCPGAVNNFRISTWSLCVLPLPENKKNSCALIFFHVYSSVSETIIEKVGCQIHVHV